MLSQQEKAAVTLDAMKGMSSEALTGLSGLKSKMAKLRANILRDQVSQLIEHQQAHGPALLVPDELRPAAPILGSEPAFPSATATLDEEGEAVAESREE